MAEVTLRKVRILVSHPYGGVLLPPNSVPALPSPVVKALVRVGHGDDTADAVAYAESLGVPVPEALDDCEGYAGGTPDNDTSPSEVKPAPKSRAKVGSDGDG